MSGSGSGRVMNFRARPLGQAAVRLPASGNSLVRSVVGLKTFLFFLLLALLAQGIAIRTHLHFAPQASSLAAAPSDRQLHVGGADRDAAAALCRLCKEAAMAGAFVLPPATVLPPPPAPV